MRSKIEDLIFTLKSSIKRMRHELAYCGRMDEFYNKMFNEMEETITRLELRAAFQDVALAIADEINLSRDQSERLQ